MSIPDENRPQAQPDVNADEQPVPSEAELERIAAPATVRRAPKFSVFIGVGAVLGIVVGVLLAVLVTLGSDGAGPLPTDVPAGQGFISFLDGQGTVNVVMGVTGAVVGGFVGGALAVWADRRSRDPLRRR